MKKNLLFVLVILALAAAGYAYLEYNKQHTDTAALQAAFTVTANELLLAFQEDESAANAKYLDQPLEVRGIVREVMQQDSASTLLLATSDMLSSISCNMSAQAVSVKAGDSVRVRGICTGYLMDVVLVRCVIINPE